MGENLRLSREGPPPQNRMKDTIRRPIIMITFVDANLLRYQSLPFDCDMFVRKVASEGLLQKKEPKYAPELGFAVELNGQRIETNDDDDHNRDPDGNIDRRIPVFYDESCSRDLVGDEDAQAVKVQPTHGEAQGTRDIAEAEQVHGTV